MKAYNPPCRIGRAARSVQGAGDGATPDGTILLVATIIVATLMLHGFEPLPCRAQTAVAGAVAAGPAAPTNSASPAGERLRDLKLKAAPLEPTDLRFPINLATALRLSDARPLIVAAAQASVWVAEAELTRAKVLWVPQLNYRLRLYPARRRRPGLQQGHHDRAQRELLLRRWRPVADTSPRPMSSSSPWSRGRSSIPGKPTSRPPRTTRCP